MGEKEGAHSFVSREKKCIHLVSTMEEYVGLKMYLPGSGSRSQGFAVTRILVLFVCFTSVSLMANSGQTGQC